MFKFLTLFLLWGAVATAQDCGAYTSPDQSQPVGITIYSPEGECFEVTVQGVKVNPEKATRVQFKTGYGLIPVVVKLDNGNTINKSIAIGDTYVQANYRIVANKKGKYKLRFEPFTGTSTGPTASEMVAEMQAKNQAKLKAEQEARDREWDEARAKEQAERDERRAKEKAEEEARDKERRDRWAADSEKRRQENPGRQGANHQGRQGANYQGKQGANHQGIQGANHQGKQGADYGSNSGSKQYADAPPQEIAEKEKDGKKYFDDYKKGHQVEFTLLYKGQPACNWDIEILLGENNVVVAKGRTDSQGKFSSTYYGLTGVPFKVAGERKKSSANVSKDVSWSVDGFWYIGDKEYKAGKLDPMNIEAFEEYISKNMGVNMSYAGYGLTTGCR